jgi:hypothetical protein
MNFTVGKTVLGISKTFKRNSQTCIKIIDFYSSIKRESLKEWEKGDIGEKKKQKQTGSKDKNS